jgi:hypothetical protein
MEYISGSDKAFNTIHANDYSFYEHLHHIIDREHIGMLAPETRGLFSSIGIEKGKPFAPDTRMMKILEDAVKIANATARSIVWYPRTDGMMKGIRKNAEGSYDIYFGPKPPKGFENNWLETNPGKGWFVALRMYGPLQEWIDKTWRPGEIELVKSAQPTNKNRS